MSSDAPKRIAISFSSSAKPNAKPSKAPPSSLGKRPRAGGFGGDDSDSDPDTHHGRQEKITGFGADGAETGRKREEVKKDYVIAKQLNKDWRGEKRRQTSGLPGTDKQDQNGDAHVERAEADQDTGIKWGLSVKERVKDEPDVKAEPTSDDEDPVANSEAYVPVIKKEDFGGPDDPEKEAMSALLGLGPKKPEAIIPSESDAYQRDVAAAGEASTLEDYDSMPVEEFGAALLRGMGWDGKERGTMRYKEVKRRPARLGLGAKELKGEEELGGWGQGGKGPKKRPRLDEYKRGKEKEREMRDARKGESSGRERDDKYASRDRDRDHDRRRDDKRRDDDRRRDRHRDDRDRRR